MRLMICIKRTQPWAGYRKSYKGSCTDRAWVGEIVTRRRSVQLALFLALALIVAGAAWTVLVKPVDVQVVRTESDVPIQVFGLGTVEAQIVSQVGFETAGTLVELHADHGDRVKAGALLARLDSREQEARVAQGRAAVT